jgi:hypothetical protein
MIEVSSFTEFNDIEARLTFFYPTASASSRLGQRQLAVHSGDHFMGSKPKVPVATWIGPLS